MSGKPFVAEACNIGVQQKSQPITLDATLCPALMCDIMSVFDVPIKTCISGRSGALSGLPSVIFLRFLMGTST
jgi:hypothetical protein